MSEKPKRRTKFTVTIYCNNCHTAGDYQFTRGTVLHAERNYTMTERRNLIPGGGDAHMIRLNDRYNGRSVECRFCNCSYALHLRQRVEPATTPTQEPTDE